MANEKFTPCLSLPDVNSPEAKYFIPKKSGGYNPAILGNNAKGLRHKVFSVLPNCVSWALGRFCWLANNKECNLLKPTNAELFIKYADKSLEVGQTPKLGSILVWEGKGNHPGHVAVCEIIKSPTEIVTSESGWSASKIFWNQVRKQGKDGNWGQNSNYKFLGFIYNPAPCCQNTNTPTNTPTNTSTNSSNTPTTNTNTPTVNQNKTIQTAKLKDTKLSGTYTVTADDGLNLRLGAGTNFDSQILMPKGTKVSNYGYYNAIGNVKWLYVQCVINGKKYLGYCSMNYLKK